MNWTERFFLVLVLLVGIGVILLTLGAVGVPIPYLTSGQTNPTDEDIRFEDIPAPLAPPDETDDGLLAELERGDEALRGLSGPGVVPNESGEHGTDGFPDGDGAGSGPEGVPDVTVKNGDERDPLVDAMKAKIDPKNPGEILAFLAAMTTPKGTKLAQEDLEFLFAALGEHEDYGIRNLLMMHLERIGGEGVTKGVLAFMAEEKNPAALQRALQTLRLQNDDAAVSGLVSFMETTKNRRLREVAFQNLLGTRNGSATDALMQILDHSQDRGLKRYALAAASQLGGATGAQAVLSYAVSSDPYERSIGLKSLKDIRSKEAVPALSAAVSQGTDLYVRQQAVRALARIRDPQAIGAVSTVATGDPNRGLRHEAIRALGTIGRAEALPTLTGISQNDANAAIRRSAEKAIASIQRQEARRAKKAKK